MVYGRIDEWMAKWMHFSDRLMDRLEDGWRMDRLRKDRLDDGWMDGLDNGENDDMDGASTDGIDSREMDGMNATWKDGLNDGWFARLMMTVWMVY